MASDFTPAAVLKEGERFSLLYIVMGIIGLYFIATPIVAIECDNIDFYTSLP